VPPERDFSWVRNWRVIVLAVVCGVAGFVIAMLLFGAPWHLPPNWGDIPTWFLVVLATAGGWFTLSQLVVQQQALKDQRKAFADQLGVQRQQLEDQNTAFEKQLAVQQQQLDDQRKAFQRDFDDRRKAQAKLVFLWTEVTTDSVLTQAQHASTGITPSSFLVAHVRNTSKQPVYDLEITWHQGAALRGSVEGHGTVMPDAGADVRRELTGGPSAAVSGSPFRVTLSFRDAAGVRWEVDEDGELKEPDAAVAPTAS
jgi:hypothetical protein